MSYECLSQERKIYFKKGSAHAIGNVERIIFDFDGVLVYTKESYRQTIRNVVDYYFLEILGLEGEKGKLATFEDIQKLKDTGLFNNDWNLTYSLTIYYLAIGIQKLQQKQVLQEFKTQFQNTRFLDLSSFLQTLGEVGASLRDYGITATELINSKNDSTKSIDSFLKQANLKNQGSFEAIISCVLQTIGREEIELIKKLIPYDLEKPDLLKRLFEETYLGQDMFTKFYGASGLFKFRDSFFEKESFIPTRKTLNNLRERFGRFGIYSEKPGLQGIYLLNKCELKEYFNEKLLFFQEDLIEPDGRRLGKPDATIFIELLKNTPLKNGGVAYLGDGVADVLLVKNAQAKGSSDLLFFGFLCSSPKPDELFSQYITYGADAIMTDVNDLPYLLDNLEK